MATCKSNPEKTTLAADPLFFTTTKIHSEDFFPESIFTQKNLTQKNISKTLFANRDITLVLDRECYLQDGLRNDFFEVSPGKIRSKAEIFSKRTSVKAKLKKNIDLSELEFLLENEPCVVGLAPNIKLHTTAPNDALYSQQRHLSAINYNANYDFYYNNSSGIRNDIVIAIIDNGTDIDHPDLAPTIWKNQIELAGRPGVDDDRNGYVDDFNGWDFASQNNNVKNKFEDDHGTHTAGLAAAVGNNQIGVSGVIGRNVKLMILNVFGEVDGADIENIDEAIRYAADNGAKVINMSIGGLGRISSTGDAIQYAVSRGVTVFAAAGNENKELTSTTFFTPASFAADIDGMISIGASNASNKNSKCSFSNYSSTYVELAVPGCDSQTPAGLLSTLAGGRYGYMYGTSMASPIAAGAGALALEMLRDYSNRELTPAQLEEVILSSASIQSFPSNFVMGNRHLDLSGITNYIRSTVAQGCP